MRLGIKSGSILRRDGLRWDDLGRDGLGQSGMTRNRLPRPGVRTAIMVVIMAVMAVVAALTTVPLLAADQPKPDQAADYGWHVPLTVSGKQGVVGLWLPPAVYLHAQSEQLHDLRVFDASGAPIPFAIHQPQPQTRSERRTLPARIFPVYGQADQGSQNPANQVNQANPANPATSAPGPLELTIQTGANGGIVSVKTGAATAHNRLQALVLDFGPSEENQPRPLIDTLRFSAPPAAASHSGVIGQSGQSGRSGQVGQVGQVGQGGYSARLWLEASDDLKQWEPLGTSELSWLANDANQVLANDRLKFEPRPLRYARLSWRSGEPVLFGSIEAETVQQVSETAKLAQLALTGSPGKNPQEWQYSLSRAIPVQKIGLQLTAENIVFPAALGHYQELPSHQAGKPTTWRFVPEFHSTFYQLTQDGKTRRFAELEVPIRQIDHWVLRPQGATAAALAAGPAPVLNVYWQPAQLIFVTSGKGPYLLAFGRDKAAPGHLDLAQVAPGLAASELQKLEQVTLGALRQNGAAQAAGQTAAAKANASAQQKTLILWGVLLLGVSVLGLMVRSLLKQMKQADQPQGGVEPADSQNR